MDGFYESLIDRYDDMTRFETRLEVSRAVLEPWIRRHRLTEILDVGCGTGVHALALAALPGLTVTGVDPSEAMLERARRNAGERRLTVRWLLGSLQDLDRTAPGPFDAAICLGNTLPHILTEADLRQALTALAAVLRPGGRLLLQQVNYHPLLAEGRRILGVNRSGEIEFVRFYDFLESNLRFNVITIDWSREPPSHSLDSTELRPWRWEELEPVLEEAGFRERQIRGDLRGGKYWAEESPNLVVEGRLG